jgi:diphosphomevalonate decarboxylase
MEANALAMHALMLATRPGLLYWSPGTVALLHAVRAWREEGVGAWATMDAGPHVCFLARREDLEMVAGLAGDVQGVRDVLVGLPAEGATAKPAREGA